MNKETDKQRTQKEKKRDRKARKKTNSFNAAETEDDIRKNRNENQTKNKEMSFSKGSKSSRSMYCMKVCMSGRREFNHLFESQGTDVTGHPFSSLRARKCILGILSDFIQMHLI
jgi:GTP-dependent phosphoenolpyruvate carboxykinase